MIGSMTGMFQVYWAMLWYYILKLPYAIRVIVAVAFSYIAVRLSIVILYRLGKKVFLPLIFWFLKCLILILQRLIYGMVKSVPGFQEKGSHLDDLLNTWGIHLEAWGRAIKENRKDFWKRIPFGKIFVLLAIAICMFVIIPFYMEPFVTGNTLKICADINIKSLEVQNNIWDFVNKYYTPVVKTASKEIKTEETEPPKSEPVVLHLNSKGKGGANLRSSPEKAKGNIILAVSGDVELTYEQEVQEKAGTVWVKVSIEDGVEGWISKSLLEPDDLKQAGIE